MKRRILLLLALALAAGLLCCGAALAETGGACGDDLTWVLDGEGNLTISGTGAMDDYLYNSGPWGTSPKTVVIEEGVTSIGGFAFYGCDSLETAIIPGSVTSIKYYAFYECWSLIEAPIPEGVTSIGAYAFCECSELMHINIPAGVVSIGEKAFYNCSDLDHTSLLLPASLTTIGPYAFGYVEIQSFDVAAGNPVFSSIDGVLYNADGTEIKLFPYGRTCWNNPGNYAIPAGVTSIGDYAFARCNLTGITIPEGVTSIGDHAFYSCSLLKYVTLPQTVTHIGDYAFYDCLTSLVVPASVTSIGSDAFDVGDPYYRHVIVAEADSAVLQYCISNGIDYVVPTGEPGIYGKCGENLSWRLDDEGTLTIWGTGEMAAYEYYVTPPWGRDIEALVVEEGVSSIGNYAFYDCGSLVRASIPMDVTSIGDSAFSGHSANLVVTVAADSAALQYCIDNGIAYEIATGGSDDNGGTWGENLSWSLSGEGILTLVGAGEMPGAPDDGELPWGQDVTAVVIGEGVTSIGEGAFAYCCDLTAVTVPSSVTSIGDRAFAYCTGLTDIALPGGLTGIGDYAFLHCENLTGIAIPGSVTSVGEGAFNSCIRLADVSIQSGATQIGEEAFRACTGLTRIEIPSGTTSISYNEFRECTGLTEVALPDSVTGIGDYAFAECTSLPGIAIPSGVTEIGEWAFAECESLTAIQIPSGVTRISDSAFRGCVGLTDVALPDGLTEIYDCAFNGCDSLVDIEIPASVTSIGWAAFGSCDGLTRVTILNPNAVIGGEDADVFEYCSEALTLVGYIDSTADACAANDGHRFLPLDAPAFVLPADLTDIEADAFQGIGAVSVWIPARVSNISGDPFNGSAVRFIYGAPGTAAETFAAANGYTFVPYAD